MKIVFLDAATMGTTPLTSIESLGEFERFDNSTAEEARMRVRDADVAIVNKVIVDQAFLDAAPRLKLVCEAGTGMNNIDAELCRKRGVQVRNVAGYSTDAVAQHTWMLILALAGRLFHYDSYVKDGRYTRARLHTDSDHPYTGLSGKTIGIVGMGAIGQKVARIAEVFGMKVLYYSTSGTSHCTEYPSVSLESLLREADVVSIHAPYNEKTAGLIDYEGLRLMKPTAFLVNTGRGGIADEADLARAIDEERIVGIGIDVYVEEPLPAESPLLNSKHPERMILTPHVAWASEETRRRLAEEIAANIRKGW
ncbi:MAG: D-2-hydroxyacid dehydrogenase [Bacteroidales bacterium]|nr:D-2-hydroxyacid dehydrogenase [Bacteroidales bacterium]